MMYEDTRRRVLNIMAAHGYKSHPAPCRGEDVCGLCAFGDNALDPCVPDPIRVQLEKFLAPARVRSNYWCIDCLDVGEYWVRVTQDFPE